MYLLQDHDRDGAASDNPPTDIDIYQESALGKRVAVSDIHMGVGMPSFTRAQDSKPSSSMPIALDSKPSSSVPYVHTSSVPIVKRTAIRKGKKSMNSIGSAVLDLINSDIQQRKVETDDPIVNYSKTVRDRLRQIQSVRRLANVKMAIDQVIHNALLEEMPEDD